MSLIFFIARERALTKSADFIPLDFKRLDEESMQQESQTFFQLMSRRRSIRDFSDQNVPQAVLENALKAAGTAPSGANMQPWHFVVVQDSEVKKRIREAAEIEEREFYELRASDEWLQALAPLGTDAKKPFLEKAPVLIAVFLKKFTVDKSGEKQKNYYTAESVGIATGILITALHKSGLATLTHTPSPMKFLSEILERPSYERPFVLLVCGYPADDAKGPDIKRHTLQEISTFIQ
jgi:nitroreductase